MSPADDVDIAHTATPHPVAKAERLSATELFKRSLAIVYPTITITALFVGWEFAVRYFAINPFILPPPSAIFQAIFIRRELFFVFAQATILEVLVGFAFATLIGIPLGILIFFSPTAKRAFYPLFVASQMVPKVAIAPVLVIWFGTELTPKVLLSFLIAFFPIMISTAVGLEATDPDMVTLFRSMGANGIRTFLKLRLPGALSNVFAGLKLGMSLAVVGAIVGEFVAADRGLGYYLLYANGQFDAVGVFATMIVLTVIGVILYFMIEMIQAFLLPKGMTAVDRFNQGSL